ncbi:MAG: hypothetical protein Q8N76_02875 [Candidatus Omnitrophota bacterium]|nr:hypothetical protein [Candidatus Omnitrophota bacterium]
MDKRKGLIAGYKKFGPTARLLFWCAVIGLVLTIVFFIIQQKTGATKEGQIAAQLDRNLKHKEGMGQLDSINSKIDIKNRPYLGVEKFSMERDNNHLTPHDYVTIYVKNYGEVPATEVIIFIDVLDEMNIKWGKGLPFRRFIPDKFAILPGDILRFDNEPLMISKIISPHKDYDKWLDFETSKRYEYFKQHNKYPWPNIYSATVEITYKGLNKEEPLFSLRSMYSRKYKDGKIVWSLNRSEVK